jgi:hypothetical protein
VLAAAGGATAAHGGCVAPKVVGVSLAQARQALAASGCGVAVHQLPAHGRFVTPASPDGRQLVARQSPPAGAHARAVGVWVEPLCSQPTFPGPARPGAEQRTGPQSLVAGLYLSGGPLQRTPRCRAAHSEAGTLTVSTPSGAVIARRSVRGGRFAIFPLAPGTYVLEGRAAGGAGKGRPAFPQATFTISAHHTTLVNLVASVR